MEYPKINYARLNNAQRVALHKQRLKELRKLMDEHPFKKYREYEAMTNGYFRKGWIAQQVHMRTV